MNIGWFEPSITSTSVLRVCGQLPGKPSGVADQSCARMSAPTWPPRARKAGERVPELALRRIVPTFLQGRLLALKLLDLLHEEAQARPYHLACVLVLPRGD